MKDDWGKESDDLSQGERWVGKRLEPTVEGPICSVCGEVERFYPMPPETTGIMEGMPGGVGLFCPNGCSGKVPDTVPFQTPAECQAYFSPPSKDQESQPSMTGSDVETKSNGPNLYTEVEKDGG